MSIPNYKKTRIAPTPSGFLHLGNVLSFSITAALAQKHGAKILLRIDDLDQARANDQYLQDIFDTLNFLEIPWDEGPRDVNEFKNTYSQVHRIGLYNETLEDLRARRRIFACTCSRQQLRDNIPCACRDKNILLNEKDASWRLIADDQAELNVKDYSGQIIHAALPGDIHNFIVRRKDGLPSYQLTSVVDDLHYGVDLIIRGQDLWSSTVAQHELANTLHKGDFHAITFYHHPLLVEPDGQKLSKSDGATSVRYLRQSGKAPVDIYRMISASLGINAEINSWQQLANTLITT
ncbi:glutamate--tRNA ligase family protein [Mucilaginibacter sp. McL0603]|uniref:glutamate--tRNA ligase family protein n=1 Tax=Mucilaginibacter sp. McL0603 TaxID=3415670 RepID=UPI003CF74A1C